MTYTSDEYDDVRELNSTPLPPTGSNSSRASGERLIRRRSSNACDGCRKAKCKCERTPEVISNGDPCRNCVLLGQECTFLGPSRKRDPQKSYIDALESKLHQLEALLGTTITSDDVLLSPDRAQLRRAFNTTACNPANGLSPQMQHLVESVVADKTIDTSGLLLIPTLPSSLSQYVRPVSRCGALKDVVPANTRPMNTTSFSRLPVDWQAYTSPEGDTYFQHEERSIVTYADIRHPSTEQVLLAAHDRLVELGGAMDFHITDREVFIQVTEKSSYTYEVGYYFIDHDARLPFWVHPAHVQDLGLPSFGTSGELKAALAPEYWTHFDYFPVHRPLDAASELELICILRHGCVDDLTSPGSTFPYSAHECSEFLRTLDGFAASGEASSYRTSTFARLWASITRSRCANGYGLNQPRLNRLQGLDEFKSSQKSDLYLQALVTLSLAFPLSKFNRIGELWNGRVVYQRHWQKFLDEQQKEWACLAALSLVVFIGAVIFICSSGPKPSAVASASISFASIISAFSLYGSYSRSRFKTASDISSWISTIESSHSGLLPLAIKFTVPQATAIYSAFLLLLALLKLAADSLRDSDAINSALLLAAAFGPGIIVYLMLRVDTWNGVSDPSEQLVDARESSCDGSEV